MYPLDIANKKACSLSLSPTACTYTLPMYTMWLAAFISILALSYAVIPFTLFFYEADSDFNLWQKIKSAAAYTLVLMVIVGLIIGIMYGEWKVSGICRRSGGAVDHDWAALVAIGIPDRQNVCSQGSSVM